MNTKVDVTEENGVRCAKTNGFFIFYACEDLGYGAQTKVDVIEDDGLQSRKTNGFPQISQF